MPDYEQIKEQLYHEMMDNFRKSIKLEVIEEIRHKMYHAAFETDSDLQKWDGGCWIRYKLFEEVISSIEIEGGMNG